MRKILSDHIVLKNFFELGLINFCYLNSLEKKLSFQVHQKAVASPCDCHWLKLRLYTSRQLVHLVYFFVSSAATVMQNNPC